MNQSVSPLMLFMIGLIVVSALVVHGAFTHDPFYGSNLASEVAMLELALN